MRGDRRSTRRIASTVRRVRRAFGFERDPKDSSRNAARTSGSWHRAAARVVFPSPPAPRSAVVMATGSAAASQQQIAESAVSRPRDEAGGQFGGHEWNTSRRTDKIVRHPVRPDLSPPSQLGSVRRPHRASEMGRSRDRPARPLRRLQCPCGSTTEAADPLGLEGS